MVDIDVFVWHDADGSITAVGTPHPSIIDRVKPIAITDRWVLHLKVPEHYIEQLHATHRIDVLKGVLVPLLPPMDSQG